MLLMPLIGIKRKMKKENVLSSYKAPSVFPLTTPTESLAEKFCVTHC